MRRTRPALLMLLAATSGVPAPLNAAGPARAEQPANYVKPDDRNAALAYWEHLGTIDAATEQKLRALDWKALDEASGGVPAALVEVTTDDLWVKAHGLVRASRLRKCNFELNYEAGPGALMPHLARMRLGGTILRAFARRAALEGNPARVGEYLAAMVRVGRHAADEPILISTLVGMAIANAAMGEAESLLRAGRMSPESRAEVLAALRDLPPRDPMGLRAAIEGERDVFLPWIDRASDDEKTMKELGAMLSQDERRGEFDALAAKGPAAVREDVAKAREPYALVLEAWDLPDARDRIEGIGARVEKGEFGVLARMLTPSYLKMVDNDRKFKGQLAATIDRLDGK
ncbi:MAG: hypothetical protein FJ255_07570 [Phycisphaerae bacterium]|nr:hypothetical protein [Phycisphaerae bacterium]